MSKTIILACLWVLLTQISAFGMTKKRTEDRPDKTYVVRDVLPEGHFYVAMESKDLEYEVELGMMSRAELEKTPDFQATREAGEFQLGLDSLLHWRAGLYCAYHGFQEAVGFNLKYIQESEFSPGKVSLIEWLDEMSPVETLPLTQWRVSSEKMKKVLEAEADKSYCGHLFFAKLTCAGWF